jgi:AraC-like DNA-binding protein
VRLGSMHILRCDPVERFVRDYQVAVAVWLPPTTATKIATASLALLLNAPEDVPVSALPVICRMIRSLADHAFGYSANVVHHGDVVGNRPSLLAERAFTLILATPGSLAWRPSMVAKILGVSRTHLSHCVKSVCGTTFILQIRGLRILRAAILLSDSHIKIADIASALGYANTSGLDREFRDWLHIPPNRFRQSVLKSSTEKLFF